MKYKSLSLLIIALLSACTLGAQNRKKVGVVLSGGGAKGVAHIGALKVIEEAGIPIDYVVGTSMGALVGGYTLSATPHSNWTALSMRKTGSFCCLIPPIRKLHC